MSSTKLITKNMAVHNVKALVTLVSATINPSYNIFYLFFGRDYAWPNESAPPQYTDMLDDDITVRQEALGLKVISEDQVCPVCPRYDWVTGTVYETYKTDEVIFGTNFYVLTSNYEVYKCISNNDGAPSTVEPSGEVVDAIITTADGYQWKFMYTLGEDSINNFLTDELLPVPYTGGDRYSGAIASNSFSSATVTEGEPPGGHGYASMEELGASSLMISQFINGDEGGLLPSSTTFRQFGIWKSPLLIEEGVTSAAKAFAEGSVYTLGAETPVDKYTGQILYVENRAPVAIESDQSVRIQIVLNF